MQTSQAEYTLDISGLTCPLPVLHCKAALHGLRCGEVLRVLATDRGALQEFPLLAAKLGHRMLAVRAAAGRYEFYLRKCEPLHRRRPHATLASILRRWKDRFVFGLPIGA